MRHARHRRKPIKREAGLRPTRARKPERRALKIKRRFLGIVLTPTARSQAKLFSMKTQKRRGGGRPALRINRKSPSRSQRSLKLASAGISIISLLE